MIREAIFQSALDADPTNSSMRLVFADWLDEKGDWRGPGYRWLGVHRKWPYDWSKSVIGCRFVTFDWYFEGGGASWEVPAHCELPSAFRDALQAFTDWVPYPSRIDAEEAICRAWASDVPNLSNR